MNRPSIVSRVVRGTVLVALVTAVALASAAALIAVAAWEARERDALGATADALCGAVRQEAAEEHRGYAESASEAVLESGVGEFRIEIWDGNRLVTETQPGAPMRGPDGRAAPGWLIAEQRVDRDLVVVVGSRRHGAEALLVFGGSLLVATPPCLLLAWLIGRSVGRRSVQPLLGFRNDIVDARPGAPLPERPEGDPLEVAQLAAAFGALWSGSRAALAREAEFAANASHELRTPLTRLRLHAERAREGASPAARRELDAQIAEIDRLVRLVESLLVLARDVSVGVPRSEPVNLADVLRTLAARVLPRDGVDAGRVGDEALVRGDDQLLSIAIENLLQNAAKFGSGGAQVRLALAEDGGRVRLRVATPGARIAASEHDRLFERFYRSPGARSDQRGHGLGLPLARHVARLHGGDVICVSGPEEDATFELDLPSWRPSPDAPGAALPAEPPPARAAGSPPLPPRK